MNEGADTRRSVQTEQLPTIPSINLNKPQSLNQQPVILVLGNNGIQSLENIGLGKQQPTQLEYLQNTGMDSKKLDFLKSFLTNNESPKDSIPTNTRNQIDFKQTERDGENLSELQTIQNELREKLEMTEKLIESQRLTSSKMQSQIESKPTTEAGLKESYGQMSRERYLKLKQQAQSELAKDSASDGSQSQRSGEGLEAVPSRNELIKVDESENEPSSLMDMYDQQSIQREK